MLNKCIAVFSLLLLPISAWGQSLGLPALTSSGEDGPQTYTLTIQVLALMTALTLLPALILSMTSFTRIIIVLSILRQAIGTAQTPPNQVLLGLAMFLTIFVMAPVLSDSYADGVAPYMAGELEPQVAIEKALLPVREFMWHQARTKDVELFADIANSPEFEKPADVPISVLIPAFITSELKTAFQIGFLMFIPFVVIDLVVASVLMSMGMMMLSPMLVSLPFKIMLFVLVDGWALLVGTLAASFFR